jgi:hypothetical protein
MGVSFSRKQENPPAKARMELVACERKDSRTNRSQIPSDATLAFLPLGVFCQKVNLGTMEILGANIVAIRAEIA